MMEDPDNLYRFEGKVYCGFVSGPISRTSESGSLSFSSKCGYAIVDGFCNSPHKHPHPGQPDTWKKD
jgi:hypothetical protein